MKHAEISAYRLPDGTRIERVEQTRGGGKWAVRINGNCLATTGEWELEPMPSGRDDSFLSRCRFNSAEEAYSAWENVVSQSPSNGN